MTQAVYTIEECRLSVEEIRMETDTACRKVRDRCTQAISTLGRECLEQPEGATHSESRALIEEKCKDDEMDFRADDSVLQKVKLGWGYPPAYRDTTVQKVQGGSGATSRTTFSMCIVIEVITEGQI